MELLLPWETSSTCLPVRLLPRSRAASSSFSDAPLGSLSSRRQSWLSAEMVVEEVEVLLRRNSISVGRMQSGAWAGNPEMFLQKQGISTPWRGST